jgi:hypothetical protein
MTKVTTLSQVNPRQAPSTAIRGRVRGSGVYGKRMLVENPTEEVVAAGDNAAADQGTEER